MSILLAVASSKTKGGLQVFSQWAGWCFPPQNIPSGIEGKLSFEFPGSQSCMMFNCHAKEEGDFPSLYYHLWNLPN